MNCRGWECSTPECVVCELEMAIHRIKHRISTLEPMSTGWKMFTGIKIGYEQALKIINK